MRNHGKARERNGLTEGSLENSEMREFEEDRSRLAAFCSPQRNRNNDSNENSSWRRDWRGNPGRGKKAWQVFNEVNIFREKSMGKNALLVSEDWFRAI